MLKYRDPGMNNSRSQKDKDKIMAAFKDARKKFELFEKFYLGLSQEAKKYLRHQSRQYKKILSEIQGIILPAVQENCSACSDFCCRLETRNYRFVIVTVWAGSAMSIICWSGGLPYYLIHVTRMRKGIYVPFGQMDASSPLITGVLGVSNSSAIGSRESLICSCFISMRKG